MCGVVCRTKFVLLAHYNSAHPEVRSVTIVTMVTIDSIVTVAIITTVRCTMVIGSCYSNDFGCHSDDPQNCYNKISQSPPLDEVAVLST